MDEWMRFAKKIARATQALCQQEGIHGGHILPPRRGARHVSVPVMLANPADRRTVYRVAPDVALAVGQQNLIVAQERNTLVYQVQLPERLWETYTRADLVDRQGTAAVGVGLAEQRQQVNIDFDRSPHLAIVGSSQVSGKSTALLSLLTGLMTTLLPHELQVLLVDPAGDCGDKLIGAEHLLLPPARSPAETAMVIDRALDEKKERETIRARKGSGLPMFIVAIDEAQNAIPKAERQQQLAGLGETIGKLDMHLVVATQKPLEETLPGVMFNLSARMVGSVPTSRDAVLLTGRSADEAPAHKLTERGDFLLVGGGQDVTRLTVAMATNEDVNNVLSGQPAEWPKLEEAWAEPDQGGRPRVEPDGRSVGHYLWALMKGEHISEKAARERLDLRHTGHVRNRDFAGEVHDTITELERG